MWILQYAYHRSISRRNYLQLRRFYDCASLDDIAGLEAALKMPVCPPTQEMSRLISEALALLPEAQRKIVRMVFFEGLSLKDIAERTGQTFSSIRHHYYRGLDLLRTSLESGKSGSPVKVVRLTEAPRVEA